MLSSRRIIVPLFVYLSLLLATAVEAHDTPLQLREHKRLMKKRSPLPQGTDTVPPVVVGAGVIPTLIPTSSDTTAAATTSTPTTSVSSTSTTTTGTGSTTGTSTETSATDTSTSTTSINTTTSTTSTPTSTSSTSSLTTQAPSTPTLNVTEAPVGGSTKTIVPTVTRTASVDQPSDTEVSTLSAAAASTNDSRGATATILIAVAASVGGIAILWTVFRKWKLASSKKFDQRLRPIDWQQPTDDDSGIPTHRRNSRASSFRSGSGHSGAGSRAHDPLDHDFTAGASTVGGYADLARGPSPLPPMQEHVTRGPSFNRGFDNGVPLHHQGFGARDPYDYNSGAPKY